MNEVYSEDTSSKFITMAWRDVVNVAIWGAAVGLAVWVLDGLLDKYVFQALMCQAGATNCGAASQYAVVTATVVGAIVGLVGLVRLRVFRPLLVVIAASMSLWGLTEILINAAWYWSILATVVMYALAYVAYAWLARIRSFLITIIAIVVLLVVVRLVFG